MPGGRAIGHEPGLRLGLGAGLAGAEGNDTGGGVEGLYGPHLASYGHASVRWGHFIPRWG